MCFTEKYLCFCLEHCEISSKHWTSLAPLIFHPILGGGMRTWLQTGRLVQGSWHEYIEEKKHTNRVRGGKAGKINRRQRHEWNGNRLLMEWVSIITLLLRRAGVLGWEKQWMRVVRMLSLCVGVQPMVNHELSFQTAIWVLYGLVLFLKSGSQIQNLHKKSMTFGAYT